MLVGRLGCQLEYTICNIGLVSIVYKTVAPHLHLNYSKPVARVRILRNRVISFHAPCDSPRAAAAAAAAAAAVAAAAMC